MKRKELNVSKINELVEKGIMDYFYLTCLDRVVPKEVNVKELAEKIGYSKTWVYKLLNLEVKNWEALVLISVIYNKQDVVDVNLQASNFEGKLSTEELYNARMLYFDYNDTKNRHLEHYINILRKLKESIDKLDWLLDAIDFENYYPIEYKIENSEVNFKLKEELSEDDKNIKVATKELKSDTEWIKADYEEEYMKLTTRFIAELNKKLRRR